MKICGKEVRLEGENLTVTASCGKDDVVRSIAGNRLPLEKISFQHSPRENCAGCIDTVELERDIPDLNLITARKVARKFVTTCPVAGLKEF